MILANQIQNRMRFDNTLRLPHRWWEAITMLAYHINVPTSSS